MAAVEEDGADGEAVAGECSVAAARCVGAADVGSATAKAVDKAVGSAATVGAAR